VGHIKIIVKVNVIFCSFFIGYHFLYYIILSLTMVVVSVMWHNCFYCGICPLMIDRSTYTWWFSGMFWLHFNPSLPQPPHQTSRYYPSPSFFFHAVTIQTDYRNSVRWPHFLLLPLVWNSIDIVDSCSFTVFKSGLKTFLFCQTFTFFQWAWYCCTLVPLKSSNLMVLCKWDYHHYRLTTWTLSWNASPCLFNIEAVLQ